MKRTDSLVCAFNRYSVGTDIKGWDLETAQTCVEIREEGTMLGVDPEAYYGYPVDVWPGTGHRSKALANNGNLLASAGKGIVNLYAAALSTLPLLSLHFR